MYAKFAKNSAGWFDSPQSFEGTAAFSAPFICEDSDPSSLTAEKTFVERVLLCTLTRNGSFHLYAEALATGTRAALEPAGGSAYGLDRFQFGLRGADTSGNGGACFQLLAFESLTNVTESTNVVYRANGVGR